MLPMEIYPRSLFANGGNKPHRYSVSFGQLLAGSVSSGCSEDFEHLGFGQFGCARRFTHSSIALGSGPPVSSPPRDAIGVQPCPMLIPARQFGEGLGGPWASAYSTIADRISHVLLRCRPIEIVGAIVRFVIIAVRAVKGRIGTWTVERRTDEIMSGSEYSLSAHPQIIASIPTKEIRAPQSPKILPLPIWIASAHPPAVRNLIVRRFCDHPPLFERKRVVVCALCAYSVGSHIAVLSRCGQGRARQQPRFRPASYRRFTLRSQAGGREIKGLKARREKERAICMRGL